MIYRHKLSRYVIYSLISSLSIYLNKIFVKTKGTKYVMNLLMVTDALVNVSDLYHF